MMDSPPSLSNRALQLPLSGIRVLDCSRVLAGPFAAMLLGDLGADVIKVEPPGGDDTRRWGPPFWGSPEDGLSAYFTSVNRNKRSIVVDLKTDAGRAVLNELATTSELLIHNFRPATAERLGLSAAQLASRHPHLVVAVIGGYAGDDPELANRPAYDLLAQAISGLMSITGEAGGGPMKVGVAVLDLVAGLEAAVAALAALLGRDRSPVRRVDVSLVEAGLTSLINVLGNYLVSGEEPKRYGSGHPNIAPYQAFVAADGHAVIAVGNDAQFARLLGVLGLADEEGRFVTNADRVERRDELVRWLSAAIAERQREELIDALQRVDVPAGPVLAVSEAVQAVVDAHAGGWIARAGAMSLAPSPLRLEGDRAAIRRPPPTLGQHTKEVLAELRASGERGRTR